MAFSDTRVGALATPVTASQAMSSLYGLAVTLVGAALLGQAEFAVFAYLVLAQGVAVGILRSSLLQPALIRQRDSEGFRTPFSHVLVVVAISCVITSVLASIVWHLSADSMIVFNLGIASTLVFDWLRHRSIARSAGWRLVWSDGVRLVIFLAAVPLCSRVHDPVMLAGISMALSAIPALLLLPDIYHVSDGEAGPFSEIRSLAWWTSVDVVVSLMASTLPMMILGLVEVTSLMGSFRFAQNWYGPLNLMFVALSMNIVTSHSLSRSELIRQAHLIALGCGGISVVLTLAGATAAFFGAGLLSGVSRDELLVAFAVVGALTFSTALCGTYLMLFRVFGHAKRAAVWRIQVVLVGAAASCLCFWRFGVNGGLIGGMVAVAVCYPLVVLVRARSVLRGQVAGSSH